MPILKYTDFIKRVSKGVDKPQKSKALSALVIIDFENSVELDGVLGYRAVDELLEQAGVRLCFALQETDIVGYLGRHQLGCFLPNLSTQAHAELAGHKILRILNEPFFHMNRHILLSARVGIALTNYKSFGLDELLRRANSAIRSASSERELLKIYTPDIDDLIMLELDLIMDLERAVEESRIYLVYQPQLLLKTEKIVGAEALLRWTHPNRGPIWPASMVRVAERTALIAKLTFWVLNTAMRHYAELRKNGIDIELSINLSAHNLREPDLVDIVSEALNLWSIPPEKIKIELTETAIMEEQKRSLDTLFRFKEMGLKISMDDFGTGYSSMALLAKLPIDELKIDITFVREMLIKPEQDRIVSTIIELAHALGMQVIAEGVENAETLFRLKTLGCDLIQGYLVSRPMLLQDFIPVVPAFKPSW